jgi:hypothetical protein
MSLHGDNGLLAESGHVRLGKKANDSVPRMAMSSSAAARKFVVIEKRREPYRSLRGWAVGLLLETGAIRDCVDHSYLCDATDPDAWRRARRLASTHPFKGATPAEAVAMIEDIMRSIGDTCPECK